MTSKLFVAFHPIFSTQNKCTTSIEGTKLVMSNINSILKDPNEKYQFLINHLLDIIVEIDLEGSFCYVSPQVKDVFGYKPEEVIGNSLFSYTYPDDRPIIMKTFEKAITEENIINLELRIRHKKGHYVPVQSKGSLVRIKNKTRLVSVLRKTSEIKLVEQKLKESEEKYRMFIENAQEGIWAIDENANTTYVNRKMSEMLGYNLDEMIGKHLFEFMDEHEFILAKKYLNRREQGIKEQHDFEFLRKDGSKIYTRLETAPIFDYIGKFKGAFAFISDITEYKISEKKLIESEKNYKKISEELEMIMDRVPGLIFYKDTENNFIRVNKYLAEAHEMTKKELENKNLFDVYPKEHALAYWNDDLEVIRSGKPKLNIEEHWETKQGPRWVNTNKIPCINEKGEIKGIIGFSSDITERKIAEQKLKESEEKYRMIFNGANDPIAIIDEINIVDCNDIFVKLFKYNNKDEIIGIPPWKISPLKQPDGKDSIKKANEFIEKALLGEPQRFYWKHMKKDGTLFDTEISLSSFKLENKKYIMAIIRDITERKKAESDLKEINQLKTELLERTSHELKTPLISIKGFTELILELYKEKLDNDVFSILQEIRQGTERLETIINKLLKTTLLDSGKYQFQPRNEDLSFLIRFCIKDLRGLAKTRNHFIKLDIPEKLVLNFEKERIYEVITHLIINAIKYTPPYGEIRVQAKNIKDYVIVSVQDNGIGLSKEERKKIFKQFGKIERYGQGWDIGTEGTGMGLYFSKKIVELHGGEIWVESEGRNKGSKFYFTLPLRKK
ncbi:MAG: PAS domain S-box protein [Candidatus Odinarchaeota archaeon]